MKPQMVMEIVIGVMLLSAAAGDFIFIKRGDGSRRTRTAGRRPRRGEA
ncbi:MAG: hypothetical protein HQ559_10210 [Lentisphaerae bacterium]|nr:hypothetical protein [Lentisphaerota bacterium]